MSYRDPREQIIAEVVSKYKRGFTFYETLSTKSKRIFQKAVVRYAKRYTQFSYKLSDLDIFLLIYKAFRTGDFNEQA